ncbi:hypothetical protein HOP50_08g52390 [Chloropicon primus]|uniref:Uncharacterized protein n=1 Tax=Chloropicon primus TaxID=1764295 RepID=A0A5B8MQR3_9CHLO|nr:hypothetical protein A3770_08p52090 [Chloropicon primus]UPR01915.1 hypothetical protein HOP50_08g52390 [Chloropicon primus]|eukprot:QDZ22691.1 hypothetical protein A3770_08p52090 [Chloropicon primus]
MRRTTKTKTATRIVTAVLALLCLLPRALCTSENKPTEELATYKTRQTWLRSWLRAERDHWIGLVKRAEFENSTESGPSSSPYEVNKLLEESRARIERYRAELQSTTFAVEWLAEEASFQDWLEGEAASQDHQDAIDDAVSEEDLVGTFLEEEQDDSLQGILYSLENALANSHKHVAARAILLSNLGGGGSAGDRCRRRRCKGRRGSGLGSLASYSMGVGSSSYNPYGGAKDSSDESDDDIGYVEDFDWSSWYDYYLDDYYFEPAEKMAMLDFYDPYGYEDYDGYYDEDYYDEEEYYDEDHEDEDLDEEDLDEGDGGGGGGGGGKKALRKRLKKAAAIIQDKLQGD